MEPKLPFENIPTIEDVLQQISKLISPLNEDCISDLTKVAKIQLAKKNKIIFQQDRYVDLVFYFIQGSVKVYRNNGYRNVLDWFCFENEFVTPIGGFFRDIPSEHNIETIENSIYVEFSKDKILELVIKHRCLETLMSKVVIVTLLKLQDRVASIQFESAAHRYEALLKIRPDIIRRVSLTDIANYLGISLETLSRVRAGIL